MKRLCIFLIISYILSMDYAEAFPGDVEESFDCPGRFPTGITFDGKNIWMADRHEKKIYQIDPASGEELRNIESPGYWPAGLAFDGESIWCADLKGGIPMSENYQGIIYKIDPANGNILHTVSAPAKVAVGLAFDGEYLWCTDARADRIIQFDQNDGTTIKQYESPTSDPEGLTWDGRYLWVSDRKKDEIYMVDPDNGMVVNIISAPGEYVRGLCFDGEDLWAADDHLNELHRITRSDDEKMKRSNKREARITYIHQITNFGPGDLLSATINLALPEDRDNQIIHDDSVVPAGDIALITDQWGQQSVQVTARDIPPGESFEAEMDIHATIYEIRYFIDPDKVGDISEAPLEVREKFLADNEKYRIDDPIIQDALAQCVGEETNPYWIARSIYNYLLENMYYEMAGGWNTAPAVLERGNGSCSEYTFVFIAMCRGAGIPARYVGSVVVRGDEASYDDVFHRWAEIYLPGYGWVPFDPSGGDNKWPRDQANYIGHLSNRFLITTQSGGGSMALEWTYNSNAWWQTEPKTYVVEDKYADWEPIK